MKMQSKCHSDTSHLWSVCVAKPFQTFPLSSKNCCVVGLTIIDTEKATGRVNIFPPELILIYSIGEARPSQNLTHRNMQDQGVQKQARLLLLLFFRLKISPSPIPCSCHLLICLISKRTSIEMSCLHAEKLYVNIHKQWLPGAPFLVTSISRTL